jgi:hypothetical protein
MRATTTTTLLLTPLLALLATATPTHILTRRAGGPIAKPLSPNCGLNDAIPSTPDISGQQPSAAFIDANQVYAYYLAMDATSDDSQAEQLELCVEQCNGFGDASANCAGVFFAHNVPLPVGQYGIPGTLMVGCQMFGKPVGKDDLVEAKAGQYTRARAKNVVCS